MLNWFGDKFRIFDRRYPVVLFSLKNNFMYNLLSFIELHFSRVYQYLFGTVFPSGFLSKSFTEGKLFGCFGHPCETIHIFGSPERLRNFMEFQHEFANSWVDRSLIRGVHVIM